MKSTPKHIHLPDLAPLRARLAGAHGSQYWRRLEEAARTPEFEEFLRDEFPACGPAHDDVSRRLFLKLMGGSLALAGLTACQGNPREQIVPYVATPEDIVPGNPVRYASMMALGGYAIGLLVESHEGRPTKIDGNPNHPASLGATDLFSQASLLDLYDPDRAQVVRLAGEISSWSEFIPAIEAEMQALAGRQGSGLRILTETVCSPVLADQLATLLARFPNARWHQYEPLARDNAFAGSQMAFGSAVETNYHFDKASVIVSLDADFLTATPATVRWARDFIDGRRMRAGTARMNRLYVMESTLTNTGAIADHRRQATPQQIEDFAGTLWNGSRGDPWVSAVLRDLQQNSGSSIVIAGEPQPPHVHALTHALNQRYGNTGKTVVYTDPVAARAENQMQSLRALVDDMRNGRVEVLVILSGNPVYTAPFDIPFTEALNKVRLRVHLTQYENETTPYCHWFLPESHFLECWGDGRAVDGTASIQQPLISPIYDTRSSCEVLAILAGQSAGGRDIVRNYWRDHGLADDKSWQAALHDGFVPNTASPPKDVVPGNIRIPARKAAQGATIVFRPDPAVFDGRFANNAWLQELPKPLTRVTWGNVVSISPRDAKDQKLEDGDVIEVQYRGSSVQGPAYTMPGQPDGVVTVYLGYGRTRSGRLGTGIGYDAYRLRPSDAPWHGTGVVVRKTGKREPLAFFQLQSDMHGRDQIRTLHFPEFLRNPSAVQNENPKESLYPAYQYTEYKWAMVIDETACIGCGVCVTACQAENNVPVVGKDQVARGRAMHWIRIDRYFEGAADNPSVYFQPVPCMHCENAPCEEVCPVGATVHSKEGLNEMVYNRCVGTRYCSNNCPYKVRRFNFYQFVDQRTESLKGVRNPDVTVRSRGVMEKCTYCIQRIQAAKIKARMQDATVPAGEIVPACAQACPTSAIFFGDLNNPNSVVTRLRSQPHNYGLLVELNTRPRTTYLARVTNPNPEV